MLPKFHSLSVLTGSQELPDLPEWGTPDFGNPSGETKMLKRNLFGFTLIEIAIVLGIIGLLLGGVLKGQELINSAKVKKTCGGLQKHSPVYLWLSGQVQGTAGR